MAPIKKQLLTYYGIATDLYLAREDGRIVGTVIDISNVGIVILTMELKCVYLVTTFHLIPKLLQGMRMTFPFDLAKTKCSGFSD